MEIKVLVQKTLKLYYIIYNFEGKQGIQKTKTEDPIKEQSLTHSLSHHTSGYGCDTFYRSTSKIL